MTVLNIAYAIGQLKPKNVCSHECFVAKCSYGQLFAVNIHARRNNEDGLIAYVLCEHDLTAVVYESVLPCAADAVLAHALGLADVAGVFRTAVGKSGAGVPCVQLGLLSGAAVVGAASAVGGCTVRDPVAVIVCFFIRSEQSIRRFFKIQHTVAVKAVVTRFSEVGAGILKQLFEAILIHCTINGFCHCCQCRSFWRSK